MRLEGSSVEAEPLRSSPISDYLWIGLVLSTAASILSPFTIFAWQMGHVGELEKLKLSRIQPLQFSVGHDQMAVSSCGTSSGGLFFE